MQIFWLNKIKYADCFRPALLYTTDLPVSRGRQTYISLPSDARQFTK